MLRAQYSTLMTGHFDCAETLFDLFAQNVMWALETHAERMSWHRAGDGNEERLLLGFAL